MRSRVKASSYEDPQPVELELEQPQYFRFFHFSRPVEDEWRV
jgi:hypothetical protein